MHREGRSRWIVEGIDHPILPLRVACRDDGKVVCVVLGPQIDELRRRAGEVGAELILHDGSRSEAARQLAEYLDGRRTRFTLDLDAVGTPFELAAWAALREIPFGETRSYADQARAIGRPGAARAVGRANSRNPIPILVPCHRVVGSDGSLTGFAGGLAVKRWLIEHESGQRALAV